MSAFAPSQILALPAALLAGSLVALVLFRLGRRRFAPRLFVVGVAGGATFALIPALLGPLVGGLHLGLPPLWDALFMAFVMGGLVEEATKLAAAWLFVRRNRARRSGADLALGVAAVALGFALTENVVYLFAAADRWPSTALARMATAVPFHAFVGLVLGFGLACAERPKSRAARLVVVACAWLGAALLHGFYDLPLFVSARAPLYPVAVNEIALAIGASTPTLVAAVYFAALVAAAGGAAAVALWLRARSGDGVEATSPAPRLRPLLLDRLVFARATGLALGGLLLLPSAIWVALTLDAWREGVSPAMTLNALSVSVASALLGLVLFGRTTPPGETRAPARRSATSRLRDPRLVGAVAALATGAAILALRGPIDAARRRVLADALVASGNAYGGQGELDRAMENFDAALRARPDFLPALIQRAAANRTYQRFDKVLEDLDAAVRLAPDEPALLGERANAHQSLHQFDEALADLDRALALKPGDPALRTMRAEIAMNRGDLDKALADLDEALKLAPDLALARAVLGDLFLQRADYPAALRELDEAIRLDPGLVTAYFTRGRLRYLRGEFPAAIADLLQANGREASAYDALWLYLARSRGGQDGRNELIFWASRLPRDAWPFPLIELFVGARSGPSALGAAANSDQLCEADFYIGEWLLLHGQDQPAIAGLRRAAGTCPRSFIEKNAADAELDRLAAAAPAPPSAAGAAASLIATGGAAYRGSAVWRQTPQDDSAQRPGSLGVQASFPQIAVKTFVTFEKAREGESGAPFGLVVRVVETAPGTAEAAFQLQGEVGVPHIAGLAYSGPIRLAGPMRRVFGDTFRADLSAPDAAFDLAVLREGAELDVPLTAASGGRPEPTGFDLRIAVDAAGAAGARDAAALWFAPAPSADAAAAPPSDTAGAGAPGDPPAAGKREAAAPDPGAAAPHYELGVVDQAQGRTEDAIAEYREAIRLDPALARAHRGLGAVWTEQGQLDDAVAALRNAVKLDPDDAESHRLLGDARLAQRAFDDAVAEYGEASRLAPAAATPHRLIGAALLERARDLSGDERTARLREACDQLVEGARLAGDDPNIPILEGMVEALLAPEAHCPP